MCVGALPWTRSACKEFDEPKQKRAIWERIEKFFYQIRLSLRKVFEACFIPIDSVFQALRKIGNQVALCHTREVRRRSACKFCPHRSSQVTPFPKTNVARGRQSWVHFNQVGMITILLDHEIQTEEPRQLEARSNFLRGLHHLRIVDDADNARRPSR